MAWDFKPGMKVVFVGGATHWKMSKGFLGFFKKPVPAGTDLREGEIYTIAEIVPGMSMLMGRQDIGLRLVEVPTPAGFGYWAGRFRPVRTTDISALEAHLNTLPVRTKTEA